MQNESTQSITLRAYLVGLAYVSRVSHILELVFYPQHVYCLVFTIHKYVIVNAIWRTNNEIPRMAWIATFFTSLSDKCLHILSRVRLNESSDKKVFVLCLMGKVGSKTCSAFWINPLKSNVFDYVQLTSLGIWVSRVKNECRRKSTHYASYETFGIL